MDEIRVEFLDATPHCAWPRYSDTHSRIGRKGYRSKSVSGQDLNFDAESRRLSHQGFYRAHHAVDLWQPSVGDNEDPGQRESCHCQAWTDMNFGRLQRGLTICSPGQSPRWRRRSTVQELLHRLGRRGTLSHSAERSTSCKTSFRLKISLSSPITTTVGSSPFNATGSQPPTSTEGLTRKTLGPTNFRANACVRE